MKLQTLNKMASTLMLSSLFNRGGIVDSKEIIALFTNHKLKYCNGKYGISRRGEPTEIPKPVYYTTQKDKMGAFIYIWSLNTDRFTKQEAELYSKLQKLWELQK